jgi:hypothetical protein
MQKKIIIPKVNLRSAFIYLERRSDGSFNLADLFLKKEGALLQDKASLYLKVPEKEKKDKRGFVLEVYRVNIADSSLRFKDRSLAESFNIELKNVDFSIYLLLPRSLKFKGSAKSFSNLNPDIYLNGEFNFTQNELKSNLILKSIPPAHFQSYYRFLGLSIKEGLIDLSSSLTMKDNLLDINCKIKANKVNLEKEGLSAIFNSDLDINLKYSLSSKEFYYNGKSIFTDAVISGLEHIDKASIKKCMVFFSDKEVYSEDLTAFIFDLPVKLKFNLSDFTNPKLRFSLISNLKLSYVQRLAQERFGFALPGEAKGEALLSLSAYFENLKDKQIDLVGMIDLKDASFKPDKIDSVIQSINGRIEFTQKKASAKGISFIYQDMPYSLDFLAEDFTSPNISFNLFSQELSLQSGFKINKTEISVDNLSAKFLDSSLKVRGSFDTASSNLNLTGSFLLNLEDLSKSLNKFKEQFKQISPKGKIDSVFKINGDIKDIKGAFVDFKFSSPVCSFYGLKAQNISGHYKQAYGIADISSLTFDFYEGKVDILSRLNLQSENLPYSLNLSLEGVKIEVLKNDTEARDKDVSGLLSGNIRLNGFSDDLSKLYGTGLLNITKGKLWELDLFKGMGKLLFAKDFANIVFYEGSSDFIVQDKYILTDNLVLKSNIASVAGKVKIGFDNTIDASLNIEIIDEAAPLSGTFKDVTTAVISKSGKFAAINITGTLKEPKYSFKPAVENIIKGIADVLKKAIRGKELSE